nr:unnamed protein product [Callosobruchus chinensis]
MKTKVVLRFLTNPNIQEGCWSISILHLTILATNTKSGNAYSSSNERRGERQKHRIFEKPPQTQTDSDEIKAQRVLVPYLSKKVVSARRGITFMVHSSRICGSTSRGFEVQTFTPRQRKKQHLKKHCNWHVTKITVEGAKCWCKMSNREKEKYYAEECKSKRSRPRRRSRRGRRSSCRSSRHRRSGSRRKLHKRSSSRMKRHGRRGDDSGHSTNQDDISSSISEQVAQVSVSEMVNERRKPLCFTPLHNDEARGSSGNGTITFPRHISAETCEDNISNRNLDDSQSEFSSNNSVEDPDFTESHSIAEDSEEAVEASTRQKRHSGQEYTTERSQKRVRSRTLKPACYSVNIFLHKQAKLNRTASY